ncbi:MAG: hypothetical protein M1268_00925 [Patescibacteria group bacterium]|nr:hypothetical protein [Actinomycetota bacterium]MCL5438535.1 hypothetical protein [Patescibacteria group bacterium]
MTRLERVELQPTGKVAQMEPAQSQRPHFRISRRGEVTGIIMAGGIAAAVMAGCTQQEKDLAHKQLDALYGKQNVNTILVAAEKFQADAVKLVATPEKQDQILALPIPVPSVISGDMVRELRQGGQNQMYKEREWFHPVYDITQEDKAHDYRGIGPWYPVAFENVDKNAAVLTSHGNVGELIVSGRDGGKVMVAVMQLDKHQHEGAWGTDPDTGRFVQSDKWDMQYNFHGLEPLQEIFVIDPDTGKILTWPDGSPVIYRANEQGIAAFAIPGTKGNDVRVGFVFKMPAQVKGEQAPEVKIERGPNDNPGKTGENPLPDSVAKPMVPEK